VPQELAAFGQGLLLSRVEIERIERHLDDCSNCCSLVADAPADPLISLLAGQEQICPPAALRVAGGYEILDELGRGGMGVVYRARQVGLNRIVAFKRMRSGSLATAEDMVRFRREAVALARLKHSNIVQVYDVGEQAGHPYLAMEYVEGSTLRECLERSPLPPHESAGLIALLADAVHFAHGQGIIHRDLKPGNILLSRPAVAMSDTANLQMAATQNESSATRSDFPTSSGAPKIADFGLAKLFDAESDETRTGMLLGTPGYMAPEQSRGPSSEVGPAADIYALGAILYEALTGRPPFRAATPLETLDLVNTCEPVPPRRLQPRIPRDLDTICLKCLRRDPAARYRSAAALAADLRRFLAGRPIEARPTGLAERCWKWVRRRPAWAAVCAAALLALCGAAAGLVLHQRQLERQAAYAEQNYRNAWQSLQHLLVKLEDPRWGDSTQLPQLRREQYEAAIPFFERILADTYPADRDLRADRVQAHSELARLHGELGRHAESERHANEAIRVLNGLIDRPAARPKFLYLRGEFNLRLAMVRAQSENVPGELGHLQAALADFEGADAGDRKDARVQARIADCLLSIGLAQSRLEQWEQAEQNYRRVLDMRRALLTADPRSTLYRARVGEVYLAVIDVAGKRNSDQALKALAELELVLQPLSTAPTDELQDVLQVAILFLRWGKLLALDDGLRARERVSVASRLMEEYRARHPGAEQALILLGDSYATRARLAADCGLYAEAIPDWDRAAALAQAPADLRFIRMNRMIALGRTSCEERALEEAAELAADEALSPDDCVYVARNLAIMSTSVRGTAQPEPQSTVFAARSMALSLQFLGRAKELGYFRDSSHCDLLERDAAFEPFHGRQDFRNLFGDPATRSDIAQSPRTETEDH
jgi:tetratricopeptide (TPR) repeat protein/tRNA A-37 threonylcarbamoyl transferase component Bud32